MYSVNTFFLLFLHQSMLYDILYALPITVISFVCISTIVISAVVRNNTKIVFTYALGGLGMTIAAAVLVFYKNGTAFNGMVRTGVYPAFFDILFCTAGVLVMLAGRTYLRRMEFEFDEFYILITLAVSGMMLMAHANHLLTVFIGIEIMSISFYTLSAYMRNKALSVEAGLKYFLLGAFATGFLLYGMALIYGATGGKMEFTAIREAVGQAPSPLLLLAGTGLLIVGLCFKVAAFPFHSWAPDVYQGAPTVVTAFMGTAGKAAAFSAFLPLINAIVPDGSREANKIYMLLAVISAASMLYGNITAIAQTNVKRMLAYSSIAQAGYLMMGVVAGSKVGAGGMMTYIAAYTLTQIGALIVAASLESRYGENLEITDYAGLSKSHPALAAFMALFMFSLTGIPPLAMFFGKYYLFTAAVEAGFTWLAVVAAVATVISAYFYLGLVVVMYFRTGGGDTTHATNEPDTQPGLSGVTLVVSALGVIVLGLLPALLLKYSGMM
jgi:NADH-quinone oxidoreductase subunit N